MRIIDRPPERSALSANSRAMRATAAAGTPVIGSCHAGVYGSVGVVVAGRPVARQPGPGHPVLGEHQVEHGGDQRAGDPRGRHAAAQQLRRCRCRSAAAPPRPPSPPAQLSRRDDARRGRGSTGRRPASAYRCPSDPFGTAGASVALVPQHRPERRLGVGLAEVGGGEELARHVAAAVDRLQRHQERQVGVAARRSRRTAAWSGRRRTPCRMTCPIAIASAPSVPGWAGSHSSANLTLSA